MSSSHSVLKVIPWAAWMQTPNKPMHRTGHSRLRQLFAGR
jgi:hypothetical protein